jgi:hypothetical protein
MPAATPRTRLIFQNLNLYVGPATISGFTATGNLYTSGAWGGTGTAATSGINLIAQLANVQSATLNVGINRQDINVFGQLGRVDQVILAPPTISLDFTYNPTDGYNEKILGFDIKGNSFISGILTKASDSKNYFLSISQQGIDDDATLNPNNRDVYAVGNAFVSNYTLNAAVGQVPSANVTVDALNVVSYTGSSGLQTPAIDPFSNVRLTGWQFQLPTGYLITGQNSIFSLRPGDITLSFPNGAGFLVPLSGSNSVNVQSVNLSIPIGRSILNRLGSPFGFSREIQFPLNATLQIRALQTEVQPGSFDTLYCNDVFYNLNLKLRQPSCAGTGLDAINLAFNAAKVSNVSLGNTIGGDSTVDISLSAQLAGATSNAGITFSGSYLGVW